MKMKVICFFLLLFSMVLLLSSCAGVKEPEALCWQKYPLERQVILENDGGKYSLLLKLEASGKGELIFREPETLQDISFEVTPEECRASYDGLSVHLEKEFLPEKGRLIYALSLPSDSVFLQNKKSEENSVRYFFTYVEEHSNYIFKVDAEGKLLQLICEGEAPFVCTFTE